MKIAMLMDGWYPIYGGGQIHVEYLSKLLVQNHNCNIDLFVRKLKDEKGNKYVYDSIDLNGKLNTYRVGPAFEFFNLFGRLFCLITTTVYLLYKAIIEKYDIIHAHAYISGIPAKIVGTLLRIPIVYTIHGSMGLDAGKIGIMAKVENWLLTGIKYDLEISVSSKILNYKNVNKNIKVIYNGVDIERFEKVKEQEKYEGLNFLFVGRFDWQKGLEYLIESVSLLDKKILDDKKIKFNLVGDGGLFDKIKNMVSENNLEKYFNLKGKLFGDDLIKEYKKNHIFILPSLAEGQPLVINEAFISGLPVLATFAGDNEFIIHEGIDGFLINHSNVEKLKNAIEKFINLSQEDINKMGKAGYTFAINELGWEHTAQKTYEEYLKLTN